MNTNNIKITSGELAICDWGDINNCIPIMYVLCFIFNNESFIVGFNVRYLKDAKNGETLYCCYSESDSDIMDSFESNITDIKFEILTYCENIWKQYENHNNIYNYLGEKL